MSEERKAKNRERAAEYRRLHPEKVKEINRRSNERAKKDPERLAKLRSYQMTYREKNRQVLSDKDRERKFGITRQEYAELFHRQDGTCAICKKPETAMRMGKIKALAVDHNHTTGAVRGLLCSDCNTGIGKLKEDRNVLLNAIKYLDEHEEPGSVVYLSGFIDRADSPG